MGKSILNLVRLEDCNGIKKSIRALTALHRRASSERSEPDRRQRGLKTRRIGGSLLGSCGREPENINRRVQKNLHRYIRR